MMFNDKYFNANTVPTLDPRLQFLKKKTQIVHVSFTLAPPQITLQSIERGYISKSVLKTKTAVTTGANFNRKWNAIVDKAIKWHCSVPGDAETSSDGF